MRLLLVTPPMVQVNSPYSATTFLAGYLKPFGYDVLQADASLELALRLFSSDGVLLVQAEVERRFARRRRIPQSVWHFRRHADAYRQTVDPTVRFLQGRMPSLARRIATRRFLPEGPRFAALHAPSTRFRMSDGSRSELHGIRNHAIHLASLYVDDLADAIRDGIDSRFELSRYAERLALMSPSFDPIADALNARPTLVDRLIDAIADEIHSRHKPDAIGLTIPFPGNVYGAFRLARRFKAIAPSLPVIMGGGYVTTELRDLSDPRIFDFADYVVLDEGELPLLRILDHIERKCPASSLLRTLRRQKNRVVFHAGRDTVSGSAALPAPPVPRNSGFAPVFDGLPLSRYFSMAETQNPMHQLWSCRRWNKLMLARGCYWHRCSFCDTSLDYIGRYRPTSAESLLEQIRTVVARTGETGFHFVDEAMPPALLRRLSERLIDERIRIHWWGNIRFDKAFTPELARLMRRAGCMAVTGGLEAATERLLKLLDKGFGLDQAALVTHAFAKAGILVHSYLMYGCPSQTTQDTVNALEFVRQLFRSRCIQSAYWHRFALTVHSPIHRSPKEFGIRLLPMPRTTFARNEAPYVDAVRCDHNRLGTGLRRAVYNYMHGVGLSADVREWFDAAVPAPSIAPDFVKRVLKRGTDATA